MNTTPFFSIVIPVYNGLTHGLPKCLDSIWNQPLDKELYEVICVDDCSTDDTRSWLKEQQAHHTNLYIIENEKNIRQGGSRNKGVKAAKGKYIVFIDQDDYYHDGSIATAYHHLKKNDIEVLVVDCAYQSPGKTSNKLQHNFSHREIMTGDEMIERNSIPYAPWKFIFLRSHMIEYDLFFVENERIEDIDWVHKLVHYAHRVQYQPILLIHYNKTGISTTMTSYKSCETVYSSLRISKRLNEMIYTTFATSNDRVKEHIRRISEMIAFVGLRNYFFFHDSTNRKRNSITQTIRSEDIKGNLLVTFAKKHPYIYSLISNILSPFGLLAMHLYRYFKYL